MQIRLIKDMACISWLRWLIDEMSDQEPLWSYTSYRFKSCLLRLLGVLGLSSLQLQPSSFRAGGAARMMKMGVPVANIKVAGGWASERALASYLQEAESAAVLLRVPAEAVTRLERLVRDLGPYRGPPALPLSAASL